ncbi:MAG: hypothetical protein D084_Lepto4C00421G0001 [Leptospirillum sp. Group IV 'UBA BS']|nr:MAG: hypothetical protein D084_Lepto4C00421G0001 [Leptospirillum sp. Group IV 'UBA BS']
MFIPCASDFVMTFLYDLTDFLKSDLGQMTIFREFDGRFQPELCLAIAARDVNMHPRFFA